MTAIPWETLESCGGHSDPENIPGNIDRLFSEDPKEREKGYWGIDNHAVVQSDLYSSAPYAARLIVDRILSGAPLYPEVARVLYELHSGANEQILEVGPLAGEPIEEICRRVVGELKSVVSSESVSDRDTIELTARLNEEPNQ